MNLPNYFLADLPAEATVSPAMIAEACQTLKRNRQNYLAQRSTAVLVDTLSHLAGQWLQPEFPFRKMVLEQGPQSTGFSRATLAHGLDRLFAQFTRDNLRGLLEQDLGHAESLDGLRPGLANSSQPQRRSVLASGPEFLVQFVSGKPPHQAVLGIALGFLTRSAQFLKCSAGTSFLPRLFAHSLYAAEPKLASCLEMAEWRGDHVEAEKILFENADCVTASGTDERLAGIRQRLDSRTRWVGRRHRVSFAFVSSEMLSPSSATAAAGLAAEDVVAWNQLGYWAPHVIYVEEGGAVGPETFAELVVEQLKQSEQRDPRADVPPEVAAAINSRRAMYLLRANHSLQSAETDYPVTRLWSSDPSTAWTVVYESEPRFQHSCLHRFIYIKRVKSLAEALQGADVVRGRVDTVGVSAAPESLPALALTLARWGVSRVCPLGQMQVPSLTAHQEGRPTLGDLVTWTDCDF
jgi:hypothetical protein